MSIAEQDGLTPQLSHPVSAVSRRRLYLYLLPLLLFPLLILVAAAFIVPSRWFALHSGNSYLANIGYGNTLHHADCQVLIYGDSTAMIGLLPAVIQQKTGLSTCNIAEFEGMTAVNGTALVDEFLATNPRPRFLVFLYSPEDLRLAPDWHGVSNFEAISYRIQHYHNVATLKLLVTHPLDYIVWAEQGMRMTLLRIRSRPMGAEKLNLRAATRGSLPLTGETLVTCDQASHEQAPDRSWLQGLRARYAIAGTQVIIDATPAPPCDVSLRFIQAHLPPEVDDRPYPVFPTNFFLANTRLHTNPEGSQVLSAMVADQISTRIGQEAKGISQQARRPASGQQSTALHKRAP